MINRRIFFKHAGTFALGTILLPACTSPTDQSRNTADTTALPDAETATGKSISAIGLQLYSVKDVLEQDFRGTLQKLADMGYKEVESYPGSQGHYYGMEAKEFSTMLSDMGLNLVSSHVGSGARDNSADSWRKASLISQFEPLVEKAAETGQRYLTCSSLDESLRKTKDDLKYAVDLFNKSGEICKKAGLQFAYHNHAFEFEKVDDVVMYDYMLENTDPELVKYEMDIFWVVNGGQDPVAYLKKYPNRFPLSHVKDMSKDDKSKNAVIGQGTIDFATILKEAEAAGMKHYLVEQESFIGTSMEAMAENYQYLSSLKI